MDEKQHIGQLFDRIAKTYDGLNHGLSLNIDRIWRKKIVRCMPSVCKVLDVAIGTADLTIEMYRRGKAEQIVGIDLSEQMMTIGKQKCDKQHIPVTFIHGNAQSMPFGEDTFDAVTCAFGCRNFQNIDEGLREMYRVLRPGGQVSILEFSYPSNILVRGIYDFYFSHILPFVGRIISRDKTAYTYLNKSVKSFFWGEEFVTHLHQAGFREGNFVPLSFGIATIYTAKKY
jgi:demethylmenaquinone methyltransferase/2-methoxy-6-polyprenyl-1,4-benzoquinol methylase